jgi:dTDP-4-dehydrorhamnose reductase
MRLLVFGRSGQLARELARRAPPEMRLTLLDRAVADLSDPDACAAALAAHPADAVIIAAAYTGVDKAEAEPELAHQVNAEAPGAIARAAAARGLPLCHVSTDYVFGGHGTAPRAPGDPTGPLNVYGASKLAGEEAVRAAGGPHAVLRTSWVFSAHGANFVKTMLRLAQSRDRLQVVGDQVGGPTPAAAIADALLVLARRLAEGQTGGTYHFSGTPEVSWASFAREIFARAGHAVEVTEIPTADYPTPARRPLNSRLDCSALQREFGIARPDWRAGLEAVLADLKEQGS